MKQFLYFMVILSIAAVAFGRPQEQAPGNPIKTLKNVEEKGEDLKAASTYGLGYGLGYGYGYGYGYPYYSGYYGLGHGYGYGYGYGYPYSYPYGGHYGFYGHPYYYG